jgi:hypothetical protein
MVNNYSKMISKLFGNLSTTPISHYHRTLEKILPLIVKPSIKFSLPFLIINNLRRFFKSNQRRKFSILNNC